MEKKKLCLIYNFAQHYRSEIFSLLDTKYDCDFFFGDKYLDVKKMDYNILTGKVTEVHNIKIGPFSYQRGVLSLLRKYDTFLMLGETHCISTWLFTFISKLYSNKRIFFWCHGWYGKESWIEKVLKRLLYKRVRGLFLYGNYAKELMINEGFDEERLFVIHNSLSYSKQISARRYLEINDIFKNHFHNNNPNLIFIGRLTKEKKLELAIKALKLSNDKGHDYNLTLIGSGNDDNNLKNIAHELSLTDRIWFYGPCYDENKIGELIYNADLCISPGSIGLTAIHSLVFGTPAITHNCFKIQGPEFEAIKEGVTGSFYEANDYRSLSDAIDKWFEENKDNRLEVRHNCMAEIDNSWNPQFQMDVFSKII